MKDKESLIRLAEAQLDARKLKAAVATYNQAEAGGADPDQCAAGRWMAWMLSGSFEKAWEESDAIRRRGAPDPHRFWQGEDVQGKCVIVRCLHGYGDTIQFMRFLPSLRARAGRVILEVPPRMVAFARTSTGLPDVISWEDAKGPSAPKWDVQVEVTELPYLFRCTTAQLPVLSNYVKAPAELAARASKVIGNSRRLRVGVVWSSGEWNPSRSIPLQSFTFLTGFPQVEFWNLQGGAIRDEWSSLGPAGNLRDAPAFCNDAGILPLAAFISRLDLVITVDTLAAHLAGALGVPTWVLLQKSADWRWMVGREDSPWYPSMRLFRQTQQSDWNEVIVRLSKTLERWSSFSRMIQRAA